ncbi:MAG: TetR-like C-terminal domain-containing protein [Verrucomicrobium sp.]
MTLFRLFETKERLLAEVLKNECITQQNMMATSAEWTGDLQADLLTHAQALDTALEQSESMISTLIGEARRHPAHAKEVIQDSIRPARQEFIQYLTLARRKGKVRSDVKLPAAVDMFTGMLLAGMLRRTSHGITDYSRKTYLETCVEVFVSGIKPQPQTESPTAAKPKEARA